VEQREFEKKINRSFITAEQYLKGYIWLKIDEKSTLSVVCGLFPFLRKGGDLHIAPPRSATDDRCEIVQLWSTNNQVLPHSVRQPRLSFCLSVTIITPSITSSLFHSRLKTHLFHKSFTPYRSSPTHRTAHWTSTGLPSRTTSALCFSSSVIFFYIWCVCIGLNWLLVSFCITRRITSYRITSYIFLYHTPKLNLVHFSHKIWHLVATMLVIFLRVN